MGSWSIVSLEKRSSDRHWCSKVLVASIHYWRFVWSSECSDVCNCRMCQQRRIFCVTGPTRAVRALSTATGGLNRWVSRSHITQRNADVLISGMLAHGVPFIAYFNALDGWGRDRSFGKEVRLLWWKCGTGLSVALFYEFSLSKTVIWRKTMLGQVNPKRSFSGHQRVVSCTNRMANDFLFAQSSTS